jgi:hypothetical protein
MYSDGLSALPQVLEAATVKNREYTLKAYETMQTELVGKAAALSSGKKCVWTAEDVGRSLWTAGMLNLYTKIPAASTSSSSVAPEAQQGGIVSTGRKRKIGT